MSYRFRLKHIYAGKEGDAANAQLKKLVKSYGAQIVSRPHTLSQRDVVLISYGDSIRQADQHPMDTLASFLRTHVGDIVNTVHLLPFYPYSSDDGFSVMDYHQVDPALGKWESIAELATDYRLMFDAVINHISRESDWFKGYLADDPKYDNFFILCPPSQDLSAVVRPRALPLLTEFQSDAGRSLHVWTTFSADQVDLNYKNYKVLVAVIEILLFYLSRGARLIRLDAIAFLWKQPGTPCIHLPETHEIIKLIRQILSEVAPEIILITETNVPHTENISYFGNGDDEAHMVYNFALPPLLAHSIIKGSSMELTDWAKSLRLFRGRTCFFNFTASHDGVGLRPVENILSKKDIERLVRTATEHGGFVSCKSNADGSQSPYELNCNYMDLLTPPSESDELRSKRMLLSQAIMLAMPGVPGIYLHSLVGSQNDSEGVKRTGHYRTINREKLDYGALESELRDTSSIRHQIMTQFKQLLRVRKKESAFHPFGTFEILSLGEAVFAILQISPNKKSSVIALHNVTNENATVFLNKAGSKLYDLISGETFSGPTIELRPYAVRWLKQKEA